MHDLCRARANLQSADEMALRKRVRQDEVAKNICAACREGKGLRLFEDQIGLAHLPVGIVMRSRRRCLGIAFGHSGLEPSAEVGDVSVAQTAVICEVSIAGSGSTAA